MGRKKSNGNYSIALFSIIGQIIATLIYTIIEIIIFIVKAIVFYASGYKKKSGNGFLKTYFNKGELGEYKVYRTACKMFGKDNVLVNVYLPCSTEEIDNTEIDVLGISNNGIYCFESKNFKGYIYGKGTDLYWTQVLNKRKKYKFYNPVRQNDGHVKALQSFLNIERNNIYPLIVFGNKANLNNVRNYLNDYCYLKELKKFIRNNENKKSCFIANYLIEQYINSLKGHTLVSDKTKQKHIEQINDLYNR